MPLGLDTNQSLNVTVDTLEINSFAVDIDRLEIHVGYDKGHMDNSTPPVFVPDIRDQLITVSGAEFLAAISAADTYANAMTAGSVSVYGALKMALYDEIKKVEGITGTVI